MDMNRFTKGAEQSPGERRLRSHCEAIRRNKDILAEVFRFLNQDPPNASAASEAFHEMQPEDQIAVWSVSPTSGGIWERWERDAIKFGRLDATDAWSVWSARVCRETQQV